TSSIRSGVTRRPRRTLPRNGRMSAGPFGPPKATTSTASNDCGTELLAWIIVRAMASGALRARVDYAPIARAVPATARLVSLDVFRGATVAGMVIVNNPGDWSQIYWPLDHAAWNGWTPTDLIFPFFLFIVGVSITLSKKSASW